MATKKKPSKKRKCDGPNCKKMISPSRTWQKYCSKDCRMGAFFLRRGKELGA